MDMEKFTKATKYWVNELADCCSQCREFIDNSGLNHKTFCINELDNATKSTLYKSCLTAIKFKDRMNTGVENIKALWESDDPQAIFFRKSAPELFMLGREMRGEMEANTKSLQVFVSIKTALEEDMLKSRMKHLGRDKTILLASA
jgi:hypothetical protein